MQDGSYKYVLVCEEYSVGSKGPPHYRLGEALRVPAV
jgi:hypothetical protein